MWILHATMSLAAVAATDVARPSRVPAQTTLVRQPALVPREAGAVELVEALFGSEKSRRAFARQDMSANEIASAEASYVREHLTCAAALETPAQPCARPSRAVRPQTASSPCPSSSSS